MSKKRRVFDIDFEADTPELETKSIGSERRGPMASAIAENADAMEQRQSAEAAIRAENDRLAHEFVALKKQGLMTTLVPLSEVKTTKLIRDRAPADERDALDLTMSIQEIGLSNPIQVEEADDGYELIQGFRRLQAFKILQESCGDEYAKIPATIVPRGEHLTKLYRRMIDENIVRKDISFGEMAALAWAYLATAPLGVEDIDAAVNALYPVSNRQRRTYIKQFARLLRRLNGDLKHVRVLSRAQGLALYKRLEDNPEGTRALRAALTAQPDRTEQDELEIITQFLKSKPESATGKSPKSAKTTFRIRTGVSEAKCTAADGRFEIRMAQDFSALDRAALERATQAFFAAIKSEGSAE
ncbi:MAG: ParB/RepB/Spo0J family partition protein [Pseudomonadota bacterium]